MTGRELKAWAVNIQDEAIIEVDNYRWEPLDPKKIRAVYAPERTMAAVCNVEDAR